MKVLRMIKRLGPGKRLSQASSMATPSTSLARCQMTIQRRRQAQTKQVLDKIRCAAEGSGHRQEQHSQRDRLAAEIGDRDAMNTVWDAWVPKSARRVPASNRSSPIRLSGCDRCSSQRSCKSCSLLPLRSPPTAAARSRPIIPPFSAHRRRSWR